ncbi:MAG TPA: phosphoglycerate dehydrogenase [Microthrixaceae bacterium]|nr:phosphoglycerate dehydrogenase [Microthrixaceae bacterium]
MRVLVTEKIAERGLERLRDAGHDVDVREGLSPEELLDAVVGAHALIIRSATKVTAEVLAAGRDLVVVGRAGIGLDNVDVAAATERGVMVVNAPQSNTLSAAEHTMALLLAQARNVPQAHAALIAGRWERSRWEGVELSDKTLGIIGLGRIGKLVAQRALAFGMRLIAYDPFVSAERARQLSVELVTLEDLMARADFVTLHLAKTPETVGLIGRELLSKAKPSLRLVNVARGGIVDEDALAEALREGKIAGAALDVFAEEPTTESPLFELDNVVVTPHLGASTAEAQDKAGATIAEMVGLALAGDFVPYAVNVSAAEASETVRPYLPLAERLGRIFAGLAKEVSGAIEIEYQGHIAEYDTRILTLSVLKGFFSVVTGEPVSYVNAPQVAEEQGIEVRPTSTTTARDFVNLITIRAGDHSIAGTLVGLKGVPSIVMIDDHTVDVPPAEHLLVVRNADQPGMIGKVGTLVGEAGVNIADMAVGSSPEGEKALMVLATDRAVPDEVVQQLRRTDGVVSVAAVSG